MLIENHEFNEIYEKYKNLVLKVAYQVSGDLQAAEDIMQDIFLTLYKEQGTEYRNIKAWLCLKAKHRALNYKKRFSREFAESTSEEKISFTESMRESSEEEYMGEYTGKQRAKLHETIMTALLEKNPKWYEAVMLVCLMEYPQEEAARKMGMKKDAFYVLLYRARKWIKKTFSVEYEELKHL